MPKGVYVRRQITSKVCLVDACGLVAHAQDLCAKHYTRLRRHGDVHSCHYKEELPPDVTGLDTHELAWAAGFFDGEGCTRLTVGKRGRQDRVQLVVGQSDLGLLERFRQAAGGIGHIYGPRQQAPGRKPIWYYYVYKFELVQAIIAALWRYLGPPKREQAARALRMLGGNNG